MQFIKTHKYKLLLALAVVGFYFMLPKPLFKVNYSLVLFDEKNNLLQAQIANDGQWRFPQCDSVPDKFKQCLITYEDKRFSYHFGVDFLALARAIKLNFTKQKTISGASTITMQVARMANKGKRNVWNKVYEMLLAVRIECGFSKNEIINLYGAHAPFGGNVVGLEAASWRYYNRPSHLLTWAEAANLAILPNAPSIIHPSKNRSWLLRKRNQLLDQLLAEKIIDLETNKLAKLEPIPDKPLKLPQDAPHLIQYIAKQLKKQKQSNKAITTSVNSYWQKQVNQILFMHNKQLAANGINNVCALVIHVPTGTIKSYIGNIYKPAENTYDNFVDIIQAPRSPGSTLKPFLYEAMLEDGMILPNTLINDIPTQVAGYSPQNFDLGYSGAVPANKALSRSLNVPAIRMLNAYKYQRFYERLKMLGITTLNKPSPHYGLALILGGGENNMFELASVYANMARLLNNYTTNSGHYNNENWFNARYETKALSNTPFLQLPMFGKMNASCVYQTFEAMDEAMRPGDEALWQQFESSRKIAWKTGTSFGFRDAWSIGVTPEYVVAVWVGNADGQGKPGLIGVQAAAPIMFDIFKILPRTSWFNPPFDEMKKAIVCQQSGYKANVNCWPVDTIYINKKNDKTGICPYHELVHLNKTKTFRVNSNCESVSNMIHESWFVLPPAVEYYYKAAHPNYKTLPPFRNDCGEGNSKQVMELIYPKKSNRLFIPVELDGNSGKAIFEVAHKYANAKIFWYLDETYIGTTQRFHQLEIAPKTGKHALTVTDDNGNSLNVNFEILGR
ncbi:MAG: penicillin-binding protein 1C [Bacteroidia bacterium]